MTPGQFHWLLFVLCLGLAAIVPSDHAALLFLSLAGFHLAFMVFCLVKGWKQAKESVWGTGWKRAGRVEP